MRNTQLVLGEGLEIGQRRDVGEVCGILEQPLGLLRLPRQTLPLADHRVHDVCNRVL